MSRQGLYEDTNANRYSDSQMQHMPSQRMQQNPGMNNFHGRPDTITPELGNPYVSAQWDRDGPRGTPSSLSHSYSEARQGGNAAQSFHQAQIADSNRDLENEANKLPVYQSHEQDMEIGYEDKPVPLTYEVLEQKFQNEILKLLKEQSDAEDAEIARHRERIVEINNQYQEKLANLRARQANRREEFLHKESEARLQQYQQAGMSNPLGSRGPNDHVYAGPRPVRMETHRGYPSVKNDYERAQQPYLGSGRSQSTEVREPYLGSGRSQGTEGRVPFPAGRVYNNAGPRYY